MRTKLLSSQNSKQISPRQSVGSFQGIDDVLIPGAEPRKEALLNSLNLKYVMIPVEDQNSNHILGVNILDKAKVMLRFSESYRKHVSGEYTQNLEMLLKAKVQEAHMQEVHERERIWDLEKKGLMNEISQLKNSHEQEI